MTFAQQNSRQYCDCYKHLFPLQIPFGISRVNRPEDSKRSLIPLLMNIGRKTGDLYSSERLSVHSPIYSKDLYLFLCHLQDARDDGKVGHSLQGNL